jgi:hypothetical protein
MVQVISYAFLYLLVEGLDLSALLDDKTPGVIGLQRELGLEPGWYRKRHVVSLTQKLAFLNACC